MLSYYFRLGLGKLRSHPALTALMVLTLAVGVATCVATLSVLQMVSKNPIPHKSARLISLVIDNATLQNYQPGEKLEEQQMTYRDSINLLAARPADLPNLRRTAIYGISEGIEPARPDLPVLEVTGLATTPDFFAMFEVPMLYGSIWSQEQERTGADVVVLSKKQAQTLFGAGNPVGKRMRMAKNEFQVIGVIDEWHPFPRYTHLINGNGGAFNGADEIFMPLTTAIRLKMGASGSTHCGQGRGPGFHGLLDSECTWIQFWFELPAATDLPKLQNFMQNYAREQKKLGRLQRPDPARLFDVMGWLQYLEVVDRDNKLAVWLSFGFLLLCLVNTVGLLLAKFSTRAAEVGVRRALGASRMEIFKQFLHETLVVGLAGAVCGVPLALLVLEWITATSFSKAVLPQISWSVLGLTVLLSLVASVLAGLLPIWRASNTTPALQLKSQ
ncbi:MAG: hypothetical protein RL748_3641 [Pseudomonadota bacterium]